MYEVAIIGGGPAGLTAAIQAKRYKINAITITDDFGGKIKNAHLVENWPGDFGISGEELSDKYKRHAKDMEINYIQDAVVAVKNKLDYFEIITNKNKYESLRLILAVGNERNKLNIDGEDKFLKKGVSYKANKEGYNYKDKIVAVIGSGDSACTSAVFLAGIAKKVYLMYRNQNLKAEPIWIDKVKNNPKIELLPKIMPTKIVGDEVVNQLICDNGDTLDIDGVFIEIGFSPSNKLVNSLGVKTEADGFIIVDANQKTSVQKVWAAGDITTNSGKLRQVVTATAEGMIALNGIYEEMRVN